MAKKPPTTEFGKRRPAPQPPPGPREPAKRSGHVALLVMGTLAVGATAYTLMPRQNCDPSPPGAVPGQTSTTCSSSHGSSGSGGSGSSSRSSFFSSDSTSHSSSGTSSDSGSGGVSRGGFGSSAHGFFGGG
ncbi:hypothetical protein JQ543_27405 [Bradyrhizobium diazoefficiens]|nr:hypothetical protein [Bradyrhizobium diazoefficiens]MBR0851499.1 hypothetical protein [Bradyrhizobium diazoefficiens]